MWVLYWVQLRWTAKAVVSITLLYTHNRSQQEQGNYLSKEKKDKRSNALEMLIDLNEQNHKDNREFQEKLLSMFGQLISAINQ